VISNKKISRQAFYEYNKTLVYNLKPYYTNVFNAWAKQYSFAYESLDIVIKEEWWTNNVTVREVASGKYIIEIARGIFERLAYIIRIMGQTEIVTSIMHTETHEDVWKNPDFSFYDEFERIDFPIQEFIRPLFYNYGEDQEAYNNDFNKYWPCYWREEDIENMQNSIPFLWVVDFLIYHEMSHILLRHLELIKQNNSNSSIREFTLGNNEPFYARHLMELHADTQAAFIAVQTLDEFKKAILGYEITPLMKQNMFNYAFLIMILFVIWGKTRTSYRRYRHLPHPHPDFRIMFLLDSVSDCLEKRSVCSLEWTEQFKKAFFAIQHSFYQIGAIGFGNSLLNPFSAAILSKHGPEKLKEWQDDFFKEYIIYKHEYNKFIQYFSYYDKTIRPASNEVLNKNYIHIKNRFEFGNPKENIHHACTNNQYLDFVYRYYSATKSDS